ncbi:MAG: prolyl oligopeptidase family serine peptidase, partial [Terrimesophilobacter sp.]
MPSPTVTPTQIVSKETAVRVHDWMTQPGGDVDAWVEIQNLRTESYLNRLSAIEYFRTSIQEIVDEPYRSAPTVRGGKSFDLRRESGEEQASLWVSDEAGERCLVSASEFGAMSDTIAEFAPSPDGSTVAWALSHGGADWMVARFRSTESGTDNDDLIDGIKWPSFAWIDNSTVAYLSWDRPPAGEELTAANSGSCVRVHLLGTAQTEDAILFQPEDTAWVIPSVSADRKWLVVQESVGTVPAKIFRQPVATAHRDGWETVVDGAGPNSYIGVCNDETLVMSHAASPMGQVIGYHSDGTRRVIFEATTMTLDGAELVGDRLLLLGNKLDGGLLQLVGVDGGNLATLVLPDDAAVEDVTVDPEGKAVYVGLQHIGGSRQVSKYSTAAEATKNALVAPHVENLAVTSPSEPHDPTMWDVSIVEVTSSDGTKVPMRVVRAAGSVPSKNAKVLLSVYGGYSVHYLSSAYHAWHGAWLKAGGVLAYAGVRGGSELGESWHEAGIRENKQRGIDDLIACIEWFEVKGWSSPKNVVI